MSTGDGVADDGVADDGVAGDGVVAESASETTRCAACGSVAHPGDRFCEECGAPLPTSEAATPDVAVTPEPGPAQVDPASAPTAVIATPSGTGETEPAPATPSGTAQADPPLWEPAAASSVAPVAAAPAIRVCTRCGGTIAPDGYCLECGEPAASERDHFRESPAAWVGGVCDRGVVHTRNEDAMALAVVGGAVGSGGSGATRPAAVLVVCDGVSSAPDSDVASLAAARAAAAEITSRLAAAPQGMGRGAFLAATTGAAAEAAGAAVVAVTPASAEATNPPSCTYVACVVEEGIVATSWIGDSRVYWLPDAGTAVQLSTDHSWASEMIAVGMPRAEAESARNAHAITRWLGKDAPEGAAPQAVLSATGPGWVLVCSDGLWNYCSPADELRALVHRLQDMVGADPTELSAALVRWACDQGGRDNVTVALARLVGDVA